MSNCLTSTLQAGLRDSRDPVADSPTSGILKGGTRGCNGWSLGRDELEVALRFWCEARTGSQMRSSIYIR